MSINHLAFVRPGTSAWEVMELEYILNGDYDRGIDLSAVAQAADKEDDYDTVRKGKLNRQTSFATKLSNEQVEMLEDWHDLTSLAEAGYCDAPSFLKLVDEKGRKLLFHHWKKDAKASRSLRRAWKWADHVICCHSATLPADVRVKAAVLKGGPVHGIGVITSWYESPVVDKAEAEFIIEERVESGRDLAVFYTVMSQIQTLCH